MRLQSTGSTVLLKFLVAVGGFHVEIGPWAMSNDTKSKKALMYFTKKCVC